MCGSGSTLKANIEREKYELEGAEMTKRYQTQWASQFLVAAELTRRGYLVSLTLGNAPTADLLVVSPSGKHFMVNGKGQSTRNFWLIKRESSQEDLFYILVYLPKEGSPRYFVLSSREMMNERKKYEGHIKARGGSYRDELGGFNWSTAFPYENRWDVLPK